VEKTIKNDEGQVAAKYDSHGSYFSYKHPYYENKWVTITRMLRNRVLILQDPKATKTASGRLWLPNKAIQRSQVGTILMRSDEYWDFFAKEWRVNEFEPGDKVLFRPISGLPVYYGSKCEVWIFRPGSMMGLLENTEGLKPHELPQTPIPTEQSDYPYEEGDDDEDIVPGLEAVERDG
jgi:co-chaperonin GroES (HSP10)